MRSNTKLKYEGQKLGNAWSSSSKSEICNEIGDFEDCWETIVKSSETKKTLSFEVKLFHREVKSQSLTKDIAWKKSKSQT